MQVVFSSATNIAILESPIYTTNSTAGGLCLHFSYSISNPKINLNVQISTSTPPSWYSVSTISYLDQSTTAGDLQPAAIQLVNGVVQIRFIADKVGITEKDETVVIDDINIVNGSCKLSAASEFINI